MVKYNIQKPQSSTVALSQKYSN